MASEKRRVFEKTQEDFDILYGCEDFGILKKNNIKWT